MIERIERLTSFVGGIPHNRRNFLPLLAAGAVGAGLASGAGIGGVAAGATGGGLLAGLGGALGGMFLGQAGGQAAGLFGQGGKFGLPQAMMTGGMGLGLMQAFGGGTSSGAAPAYKINLSKEGKALEKTYYETAKKQYEGGLLPQNLASIYIGKIKRQEGQRQRASQGMLQAMGGADVRTGLGPKALMSEMGARVEGLVEPTRWRTGVREEEFRNALTNLANLRNLQLQTPLLKAQSQFAKSMMGQRQGAAQGQAMGDVARYFAMMRYPAMG